MAFAEAPTRYEIEQYIRSVAIENNVPPSWAANIAWKESKYNPEAIGDHGRARGIWQFWKGTWDVFSKKYLNETDQKFADYTNWRWQTIVAIRALADNQWAHWYNSAMAKEKEVKDYDQYTLCSCMYFLWNEKNIKLKGNAVDLISNTIQPKSGDIILFRYGKIGHAAFIENLSKDGYFISETNFIPCQFSERFVNKYDSNIYGFIAPELVNKL